MVNREASESVSMPRYFFNFVSANASVADLIGRDLPDHIEARSVAAKLAADLATDHAVEGRPPKFEWIEVIDEHERPVVRLPVGDVIREPNRRS